MRTAAPPLSASPSASLFTTSYAHVPTASATLPSTTQRRVNSIHGDGAAAPAPASPSLTPVNDSVMHRTSGLSALAASDTTRPTTTTTTGNAYAFDALLVATSVACTLLVVLIFVLVVGVRLLKRVAAAVVEAEDARAGEGRRQRRRRQQPRRVYGARTGDVGQHEDGDLPEGEGDAREGGRTVRGDAAHDASNAGGEAQPLLHHERTTSDERRRGHAASRARPIAPLSATSPASISVLDAISIVFRAGAASTSRHRDAPTPPDTEEDDTASSEHGTDERDRRRRRRRPRHSPSRHAVRRRSDDAGAFAAYDDVDSPCAAARRGRRHGRRPAAVVVDRDGSPHSSSRGSSSSSSISAEDDRGGRCRAEAAVGPAARASVPGRTAAVAASAGVAAASSLSSSRCAHGRPHNGAAEATRRAQHSTALDAARDTDTAATVPLPVFTATTEKDKVVYNTTHDSRYRLLQRIGMGAFSSVYLVQHKTTGQRYALKYILCKDDRERVAALRECELIHTLQGHPQVIRIVDMFMNYQFQRAPASPIGASEERPGASRPFPAADQKLTPALTAATASSALRPQPPAVSHASWGRRSDSVAAANATATPTSPLANGEPPPPAALTRWVGVQLKGLGDAAMTKVGSSTRLDDAEVTAALQSRIRRLAMDAPQRPTHAHGQRTHLEGGEEEGDEQQQEDGGAPFQQRWARGGLSGPAAAEARIMAHDAHGDAASSCASTTGGPGYFDESDAASGRGTAVHADDDGLASSERLVLSAADTERLLMDARRLQRQRRRQREQQRQQRQRQQQQQQQQLQPASHAQTPSIHAQQPQQPQQRTWSVNPSASASSHDVRSMQHSVQHASRSNSSSVHLMVHPFGVSPTRLGTPAAPASTAAAAGAATTDSWGMTPDLNTNNISSSGGDGVVGMAAGAAVSCGRPRVASTTSLSSRGAVACVVGAGVCAPPACDGAAAAETEATNDGDASAAGVTALQTNARRRGDASVECRAADGAVATDERADEAHPHAPQPAVDPHPTAIAQDADTESSSSVTTTSGEEEEPLQPIHRILVPPPAFMLPPPASPTAATAADAPSPPTPHVRRPSAVEAPVAGAAAPTAVSTTTVTTTTTTASYAPARRAAPAGSPMRNRYANFPTAAAAAPSTVITALTATTTATPSSTVREAAGVVVTGYALSREPPPQTIAPSPAATYAPARASPPAGAAASTHDPVRYKDFVPAHASAATSTSPAPPPPPPPPMSASWTGMLRQSSHLAAAQQLQQQQRSLSADGGAHAGPVSQSYGGYTSPGALATAKAASLESGSAMPMPPTGLARDRQTGAYVNPYLDHTTGADTAAAPRTSYAPRGGVRYSGPVAPPQPATTTTTPSMTAAVSTHSTGVARTGSASTLSSSGLGAAAGAVAAPASPSSPASPLTSNGHSQAQSSYAPATAPRGSTPALMPYPAHPAAAAAAAGAVVRNTYAPLRYGNLIPPGVSPPPASLPSQLQLQKLMQQAALYPTNIASPTAHPSAGVGAGTAAGEAASVPFPPSCNAAGVSGRLSVSAAIRAARAGQQGERMHWNDGKPHIHVPAADGAMASTPASSASTPQPSRRVLPSGATVACLQPVMGGGRPPSTATTRTATSPPHDAPSPTQPQYTNLGVLLAGDSMTGDPGTPRRRGLAQAGPGRERGYGSTGTSDTRGRAELPAFPSRGNGSAVAGAAAASAAAVSVRYANVGNAHLWTATSAGARDAVHVDAASAAAVAALTGVPLRAAGVGSGSGGHPTAASSSPAGGPTARDAKSAATSASVNSPTTTSSGSLLQDVRDTGYLCLVMEYHPMGDLCRYALRAKHALEQRQHSPTPPPPLSAAGAGVSGVASMPSPSSAAAAVVSPAPVMATNTSTLHTAATHDSEGSSVQRWHPSPTPAAAQTALNADGNSGGTTNNTNNTTATTTTAASLLAAAAAATWRMRPAASHADLPLVAPGAASRGAAAQPRACTADAHADPHEASDAVDPTGDNPLTEAQLLSIAYQLASVLDHMHRQNPPIIHRDLKPENILIKGALSEYLDLDALSTATAATAAAGAAAAASASWTTTSGPASPVCGAEAQARLHASAARMRGSPSTNAVHPGASVSGMDKSIASPATPCSTGPAAAARAAAVAAAAGTSGPLPPIRITRAVVPIVLTDFGLAILQDTHGRPHGGRGGGTRPYIAPESWHGGTCTASDVWSLGCVLYALATCRLVAKNVRIMSQEAKQDGFASRMLNDILAKRYSLAFASFVVSLLVVDTAKRPTAAQAAQCFCVADGEVRFDPNSPFFSNVLDL